MSVHAAGARCTRATEKYPAVYGAVKPRSPGKTLSRRGEVLLSADDIPLRAGHIPDHLCHQVHRGSHMQDHRGHIELRVKGMLRQVISHHIGTSL